MEGVEREARRAKALDMQKLMQMWSPMPTAARRSSPAPAAACGAGARADHRSGSALLDEPLSALDPFLKVRMRAELKKLQKTLGISFVHSPTAMRRRSALADLIVIMNDWRIEQAGTPRAVFEPPPPPTWRASCATTM